jgi:two-component system phosphate regulon sensor histidine kinase PhoR
MRSSIIVLVALTIVLTGGLGLYLSQGQLSWTLATGIVVAAVIAGLAGWLLYRRIEQPMNAFTQKVIQSAGRKGDAKARGITGLSYALDSLEAEHKKTLDKVHQQQDTLSAALSTMADGLIIADDSGMVSLANASAEKMLELPAGKAMGASLIEVVRDHEAVELWRSCLEKGETQTRLLEMLPARRTLRIIATPLRSGELSGALLTLQDITELRRLEAMRRDFIANASHELRTPLTSLKAIVETLNEGAIDNPVAAKAFIDRADKEIGRLAQMVQQLSQLSQLESQQMALNKEPLDISSLLRKVVDRFQPMAGKAGMDLQLRLPLDSIEAIADEGKVEQVVAELVYNAMKFTPRGGRVIVSARSVEQQALISVGDNGIGISADDLPHVFERFYKSDKARATQGTGLGLALAKHIVEVHGGNIGVESALGQGSTFTFTLPRHSSERL